MPGHVDGVEDDPAKHEKPKKCLEDRLADSNLKSSKVSIDVCFLPTMLVVRAEQTAAQRNWEKLRRLTRIRLELSKTFHEN